MFEEDGLYGFLTADPTVNGFVDGRVYAVLLPKNPVLPAIVHMIVASVAADSLEGDESTEGRRVQFDHYAKDRKTARLLSRAVRSLLVPKADGSGTTKTVSYSLPDGTQILSARVHMDHDMPFEEGPSGYIHRALLDIEFFYIPAN